MITKDARRSKPPTYEELAKQLKINQAALEAEEYMVRMRHESLINTNKQLLERLP